MCPATEILDFSVSEISLSAWGSGPQEALVADLSQPRGHRPRDPRDSAQLAGDLVWEGRLLVSHTHVNHWKALADQAHLVFGCSGSIVFAEKAPTPACRPRVCGRLPRSPRSGLFRTAGGGIAEWLAARSPRTERCAPSGLQPCLALCSRAELEFSCARQTADKTTPYVPNAPRLADLQRSERSGVVHHLFGT